MDLRQLRTLIAIAERRSFAAAADALGLTQSAISLHVKALEAALGTVLFDRTTRPPRLNAQGEILVERAREIVRQCDGLTESISGDDVTGVLELGAVPTTIAGVLPRALAALKRSNPGLMVRLTSDLSAELVDRVLKGALDVAMVSEPTLLATGLSWHPVVREPLMVIAPDGTPGDTDRALLGALPFIRFKRFAWAGRLIDLHLRDRGIRVTPGMEIDSLEAAATLVAHGLGVSVVPMRPLGEPFPAGVRALPFGEPPQFRAVGLVERTANPKADLVKTLYGELLAQCEVAK